MFAYVSKNTVLLCLITIDKDVLRKLTDLKCILCLIPNETVCKVKPKGSESD